jgi:UDP-N-acetylglucosamine--N-acetylmuramyl-(pentapeptide) pyrophosphoryl-undecaprenol N-acetylglucosamine transferase
MRIVLTGGVTGGHFYPLIAVAEQLNEISKQNRLLRPELYFMSTDSYNEGLLYQQNITFVKITSGKIRRHKTIGNLILNFFDLGKIAFGAITTVWKMFRIYPDVVFSKGGYASFPAVFAARILAIPVVIHESDSRPGLVNKWAGKFARKIAISYPEAVKYFPKERTAYTGNPIRKEIEEPLPTGGHELLGLKGGLPTIFVIGGSQGAKYINEVIMDALPDLVEHYEIIHQTGKNNLKIIEETRNVVLMNNKNKSRYLAVDYLDVLKLRAASSAADLVISRAGSTIFEIASWGKPSIIIPIPETVSHDQRSNAYAYARSGAAVVIEEKNLTRGVLLSEIERITKSDEVKKKMHYAALSFSRRDAAMLIAREVLSISLEHEK